MTTNTTPLMATHLALEIARAAAEVALSEILEFSATKAAGELEAPKMLSAIIDARSAVHQTTDALHSFRKAAYEQLDI